MAVLCAQQSKGSIRKVAIRMFSTRTSQVVPHLSTNRACPCLTAQIERDAVLSRKYGRTCQYKGGCAIYTMCKQSGSKQAAPPVPYWSAMLPALGQSAYWNLIGAFTRAAYTQVETHSESLYVSRVLAGPASQGTH